jgi:hypothetical protein
MYLKTEKMWQLAGSKYGRSRCGAEVIAGQLTPRQKKSLLY